MAAQYAIEVVMSDPRIERQTKAIYEQLIRHAQNGHHGDGAIEAIAARHAGMKVLGISCISNMAAGISAVPLSHKEVQETADRVAPDFKKLLTASIKEFGAL